MDGPLELGRVGLNNRLKAGGRKKTKDGPFNSVGRRVVTEVVVVVVVGADYLMCFGLLCVNYLDYVRTHPQNYLNKKKIK